MFDLMKVTRKCSGSVRFRGVRPKCECDCLRLFLARNKCMELRISCRFGWCMRVYACECMCARICCNVPDIVRLRARTSSLSHRDV